MQKRLILDKLFVESDTHGILNSSLAGDGVNNGHEVQLE